MRHDAWFCMYGAWCMVHLYVWGAVCTSLFDSYAGNRPSVFPQSVISKHPMPSRLHYLTNNLFDQIALSRRVSNLIQPIKQNTALWAID